MEYSNGERERFTVEEWYPVASYCSKQTEYTKHRLNGDGDCFYMFVRTSPSTPALQTEVKTKEGSSDLVQ